MIRTKPWLRKTLFVLVALTLLVVAGLVWARVVANARLEEQLDLVRASGGPETLANAAPPAVDPDRNAATLLEEAFALFEDEPFDPFDAEAWAPYERFWEDPYVADEETAGVVAAWVARNERPLEILARALERPACRFNLDWSSTVDMKFDVIPGLQLAVRLLQAQAVLCVRRGEIDAALEKCGGILRLADLGGRDPLLILLLVRMGIEHVGLETAREALARGRAGAEALARYHGVLLSLPYEGVLGRTLLVERAFGSSWAFAVEEDPAVAKTVGMLDFEESLPRRVLRWFMSTTMARLDHARWLQTMRRVLVLIDRPYREARADWQTFTRGLDDRPWYERFGAGACSIFHTVALRHAVHRAHLDLAALALGVEQFLVLEGRLPTGLAELPLERVPDDRFGAGPYRYAPGEGGRGYVLYSLGPNGVDDGGVEADDDPEEGDLAWRREPR